MIAGKIGRATAVVTFAGTLGRLGTFVGSLVMVRRLGIEGIGALGLIESWLTLGTMFAFFGVSGAATRHLAFAVEREPTEVRPLMQASTLLTLLFSLVVAAVGWLWLNLDSSRSSPAALLAPYRGLVVALLLLYSVRGLLTSFVYGLQSYSVLINANIAVGIAAPILTLWLVSAGNVAAALWVRILLTAIEAALLLPPVVSTWKQHAAPAHSLRSSARRLLAFGLPTFIGQAAVSPIQTFALSFLAAQPEGIVQVGLIATAQRLLGFVNFLPASLASTLTPILSAEWGKGDLSSFRASLLSAIRLTWATALPITVGCIAASAILLERLFGPEYRSAQAVTIALLVIMLLTALNESADRALAASNRMWISTINSAGWAVTCFFLFPIFISRYLALGYSVTFCATFIVYVVIQFFWLRKLFGLEPRSLLLPLVLSILLVTGAALTSALNPMLQIAGSIALTIITIAVVWLFLISENERQYIQARFGRMRLRRFFTNTP